MRPRGCILPLFLVNLIAGNTAPDACSKTQCNVCTCTDYQTRHKTISRRDQGITFPRKGGHYGPCLHDIWNIGIQGSSGIRLHFEKFQLGSGDWLKVYDGQKSQSSLIIKWDSDNAPVDVVSSGNRVTLEFKSDNCNEGAGFRASIKRSSKWLFQISDTVFMLHSTYGLIFNFPLACGKLIRVPLGASRTIKSPNFPGLYSNGANCLWTIVSKNRLFSAQIRLPNLETERNSDIISITDALDNTATKMPFSGQVQKQTINVMNSPGFSIAFTSDVSVRYDGFKIVINSHPRGEV